MGRNRDTGLMVGLVVSLTLHAALAYASIVASVSGRVGEDPYAAAPLLELVEPPPPPEPEEEERTIRLGNEDSDAVTATWLGGTEDLPHGGELSTVDQAAAALPFGERPGPFAIAQAPSPSMPTTAQPSEPAQETSAPPTAAQTPAPTPLPTPVEARPDEPRDADVDATREVDAPAADAVEDHTRDELLDEARRLLAQAASLLEVIAASPPPPPPSSRATDGPLSPETLEEMPDAPDDTLPTLDEPTAQEQADTTPLTIATPGAAPSDSAGATPDPSPGEITDSESDGMTTREEFVAEPGKPLAAKGMEIKTVRPRWSHYTLITSNPRNALVRLKFNREGRVIEAKIVQSSGRPDVDRPLLAAMYDWRASGAPLRELPPDVEGEEPHTIEVHFRVVLRR